MSEDQIAPLIQWAAQQTEITARLVQKIELLEHSLVELERRLDAL